MKSKADIFPGQVGTPNSDFLYGAPKSESSEGADDGTPWCPEAVLDEWAFHEALLYRGGISPDGEFDTRQKSQYLDALYNIINHWVGRGFQSQSSAASNSIFVPLPFGPVNGSDWTLHQTVSPGSPTRLWYRQSTIDITKRLVLPFQMYVPRFIITGVRITVRNTYSAGTNMRLILGYVPRGESSDGTIFMNKELATSTERGLYTLDTPHLMDRINSYTLEIQPASQPNPANGSFPSIWSIELVGEFNPMPLTAGPAGL
jgi:hypothetical protein